jgi:hypothetical protein
VAQDVASSMSVLERLQSFQYKDANSRDHVSRLSFFLSHFCHCLMTLYVYRALPQMELVHRTK